MMESAREYHDLTSYRRQDMSGHFLDWSSQPDVFKKCPGIRIIPLSRELDRPEKRLSDLFTLQAPADANLSIDMDRLSRIVFQAHALTAKARHGGTDFFYRSVASAGALYPFELYAAVLHVLGLDPGLYHQSVADQSMTLIREGNVVGALAPMISVDPSAPPAVVFLLTSIFFRSSWKYRDRAYRYHLLDTGHLAENLALALKSERLGHRFVYDFDDQAVNSLMGVDASREACLAAVAVWAPTGESDVGEESLGDPVEGLAEASRVSPREIEYPSILEIHAASSQVAGCGGMMRSMSANLGVVTNDERKVSSPKQWPESLGYAEAVFKRRSMRNFVQDALSADYLAGLLTALTWDGTSESDELFPGNDAVAVGFLAGNVEGLEPGFYLLDREKKTISNVFHKSVIADMMHICLDQAWLANCAVHFLFLTNMQVLETSRGPRGYRHAMLAAGRLGQRLYVAATAMRLGCCGIGAFYDDEAVRLLGLNSESRLLYLVAVGPVKKWSTK